MDAMFWSSENKIYQPNHDYHGKGFLALEL
jgi:hypothetical protein